MEIVCAPKLTTDQLRDAEMKLTLRSFWPDNVKLQQSLVSSVNYVTCKVSVGMVRLIIQAIVIPTFGSEIPHWPLIIDQSL